MAKLQTGTLRKASGWMRQRISKRNIEPLSASGAIDDEFWILLEYFSETESVGTKFLIDNGISRRIVKRIFKHFQSYIRQAKNYYYSAKILHPRSAGLLYYYCFLNLAKALLVIKNPHIAGKRINHGISSSPENFSKFESQTLRILKDEHVFPKLYKLLYGIDIKPQFLNIQSLFNYCTDISYQSILVGLGACKMLPGYYVKLIDKNSKTAWPLLGIATFDQCEKYKKSLKFFYNNFEKIDVPEHDAREYFKIDNAQLKMFTFFQSKKVFNWIGESYIPIPEMDQFVFDSLPYLIQTNYFQADYDLYISLPYSVNRQVPLDETTAIYLIMYYLSSLVRYNPSYLEDLFSKKEAWLIDSFIRSCSLTFLRSIISKITNTDYIIVNR